MFDFIKKIFEGSNSENKKKAMPKELTDFLEKINQEVYPEGTSQMVREIKEVAGIIHCDVRDLTNVYGYAANRPFVGACSKEEVVRGIKSHTNSLNDEQIEGLAHYVFSKMVRQRMGVTDQKAIDMFLKGFGFVNKKGDYDIIPGAYGEFGISNTNPVPVNGVPNNESYLRRLVTEDGRPITWNRLGSGGAPNSDECIDIYEITDDLGQERQTIYICPYHPRTSKLAPKGYRFK